MREEIVLVKPRVNPLSTICIKERMQYKALGGGKAGSDYKLLPFS